MGVGGSVADRLGFIAAIIASAALAAWYMQSAQLFLWLAVPWVLVTCWPGFKAPHHPYRRLLLAYAVGLLATALIIGLRHTR